ncbi:recombinase family protein [Candidatus Poriferisodalis sp.]|uniref:recombinase family protein n=1 Tax=Candidatus Poriferisodalis sp. TaxID=3101277 RepID=UPI003B02BED7
MYEQMYVSESKRVISYARVSTGAQAASGLGTEAQHRAVRAAAAERGWHIVDTYTDDAVSATIEPQKRRQLAEALTRLDAGDADVIAAARLDRFIRSVRDLQTLLDLSADGGWEVVGLDLPVNPDLPVGSFLRTLLSAFNELDRALISERTIAALAVARSRGTRLGRPSRQPETAKELAVAMRSDGKSLRMIASALTESGIRTATGKITWHPSTIKALLRTADFDKEAEANAAQYAAEHRKS